MRNKGWMKTESPMRIVSVGDFYSMGTFMNVFAAASATYNTNRSMIRKLWLLFLMYISQKIFLCFNWTLMPILLRQKGISLGSIGFAALVFSPWALKFLYASMVDRFYWTSMGKRKSWIVPLMAFSLLIMPLLSLVSPQDHLGILLLVVFVMNFIFATVDIAVDGYATDILLPEERPWGNIIQIAGYVLGYMLGAGGFLILYQSQGWQATVWVIASMQALVILPIVFHHEMLPCKVTTPKQLTSKERVAKIGRRAFLNQPTIRCFLLLAALLALIDQGSGPLRLALLADQGVESAAIGRLNLWFGAPMCLLGAMLSGAMLKKMGFHRILVLGCVTAACIHGHSALISKGFFSNWMGFGIMLGGEKLTSGVITFLNYSLIMNLSVGNRSATDYAILSSLASLFGFAINPLMGRFGDTIGFFHLYVGLGFLSIAVILMGRWLLDRIITSG